MMRKCNVNFWGPIMNKKNVGMVKNLVEQLLLLCKPTLLNQKTTYKHHLTNTPSNFHKLFSSFINLDIDLPTVVHHSI
jgi:hypothetical protein